MRNYRLIDAVSVSAILGSAAILSSVIWGLSPRPNGALHRETGTAMASLALKRIAPEGQVEVFCRDHSEFNQPAETIALKAFEKKLRREGARISPVRAIAVDPLRPLEVPPGDFFEALRRTPPTGVIVSFMGPPRLTEEQRRNLPPVTAPVVAFCPGRNSDDVSLHQLFSERLIHAAIVSQKTSSTVPNRARAAPVQSRFEQLYEVIEAPLGHASTSSK